jgi:Rab-GTPase-TBC domain
VDLHTRRLKHSHAKSITMNRKKQSPPVDFRNSLHGLSYDATTASKPPVLYTPSPTSPRSEVEPPTFISAKLKSNNEKSDWDLASSTTKNSRTSLSTDGQRASSLTSVPSVPQIRLENDPLPSQQERTPSRPRSSRSNNSSKSNKARPSTAPTEEFRGLTLDIPSGAMSDLMPTGNVEFSKRGSMLIDGRKANNAGKPDSTGLSPRTSAKKPRSSPSLRVRPEAKVLSTDEEMLSQKVRAFYEAGLDLDHGTSRSPSLAQKIDLGWQSTLEGLGDNVMPSVSRATSTSDVRSVHSGTHSNGRRASIMQREENELAGGLEDWQDIDVADVDRYGFIIVKSPSTSSFADGTIKRSDTMRDPASLQRVATSLHLASETPRRKGTIKRTPSTTQHSRPPSNSSASRQQSVKRPTSSQSGYHAPIANLSKTRSATNRLPYNKNRKLLDEAGDMLTLPPGLENIPENGQVVGVENRARRKETEREEKWRKMARVVSNDPAGGGMVFTFDTHDPKLVERTWKGIPDRWRATAWHAFLSASAKKRPGSHSDEDLTEAFNEYLSLSSPDDVQIDIDVPRTISSHIMFRRRYRGGQRLLFRVLHAMSLHFPDTGYVQGMAALAATLLAYYEEERAFVMLVRLWDLRGLDRLYKSGFGGLMEALDDFEKHWLGAGELAAKLVRLFHVASICPVPHRSSRMA